MVPDLDRAARVSVARIFRTCSTAWTCGLVRGTICAARVAGLGTFGATMSRRLSIYLLLAALATVGATASWIVVGAEQSRAELALIRGDIAAAKWSTTRARLDELAGSIGAHRRAVAGLAVIEALTDDDSLHSPTRVTARDLSYYPLGLLL